MKKYLKVLLPLVFVLALALALSIAVFAESSANEAKIDNTEYATLEAAIAAAQADDTVVILKDIDRVFSVTENNATTNTIKIRRNLTIDMNGHKITAGAPANAGDALLSITQPGVTFKIVGEGEFTVNQRFLMISSNCADSKIVIDGSGAGITVNQKVGQTILLTSSGLGADFTNTHFYSGASYTSPFFQVSSGTVSFKNSTIIASHDNGRLFSFKKAGVKFEFDGCYASAGKLIFTGDVFNETNAEIKVDNPADFVMLDAKNSVFHANVVKNNPFIVNFGGKGKIRVAGTMNFDNCELASYRIFENGANSGVTGLSGGELEDGYTLNINCTNSNINVLTFTNSGQIVRGYVNYRFEDCNIGSLANGGIGGYITGDYITVINCHFSRDISKDPNAWTWLNVNSIKEGVEWCYDVSNTEYPYYLCEASKKPVQPDNVLFHAYNINAKDAAFPYIGTSSTDKNVNNTNYGGNFSLKQGRLDAVSDINGSYYKYTVTDLDGNIPETPTTIKSTEDPFLILGDDSKPNIIAVKDQKIIVIEFDIKLDDFGISRINVAPQMRTLTSASGVTNTSVAISSGKIGSVSAKDSQWHHIQMVIDVKQTEVQVTENGVPVTANKYNGSTYTIYVDGVKANTDKLYAVNEGQAFPITYKYKDENNVEQQAEDASELYVQGARINILKNNDQTTGASVSFDNILIHTYSNAEDFNVGGARPDNGTLINNGDRIHSINLEKQEALHVVSDRIPAASDLNVSLKSGLVNDGVIYSDFKGIITDKSQLPAGDLIGEQIFVHLPNGTIGKFYATYSANPAGVVAYDKDGKAYMSADNGAEFKTLFELMNDGDTAKVMAEEFVIEKDTVKLSSTTKKTLNLDLAGNTISKIRKSFMFENLGNITLNVYSSLPGGTINARGVFDNSVNPSDQFYNFNSHFGSAMFALKQENATLNLGKYESYPGSNLTITGAYMAEVSQDIKGATINIDGGTYVRTVHDSIGFIGLRAGTDAIVNITGANILSGEREPANFFTVVQGSTATVTVENSAVFMPLPANGTAKALFDDLSADATATFKNTSFSNVSLTPNKSGYSKIKLESGCTYSDSCIVSEVDFGSCAPAQLNEAWAQTPTGDLTALPYTNVASEGSVTYHFYREGSDSTKGKYKLVWTGETATDANSATVPTANSAILYGNISDVCDGDAANGYTLKSGFAYGSKGGIEKEVVTTAYVIATGATAPEGALYYEMPAQTNVVLSAGQRIITWCIDDAAVTEIRDAGDDTAPAGFELPSSRIGAYEYTWIVETNGLYETRTAHFEYTFSLKQNISLNENFTYNLYFNKSAVDNGGVKATILINGAEINLANAPIYNYLGVDYYTVSITNIAATNGGDAFKIVATILHADDSWETEATKDMIFDFSIPQYAQQVLSTDGMSAETKQMMADVLFYIKSAAEWANYTEREGYGNVVNALSAYEAASITPTDTDAIDFAALAKAPAGVSSALDGATFVIGSSVSIRFYINALYSGNLTLTYKDKNGEDVTNTFAIESGKCDGKSYVDLTVKAYYVANDVTITFDGQADATNAVYNLASYIDYYKDDAKLAPLAKALYAYAQSALNYQNSLSSN